MTKGENIRVINMLIIFLDLSVSEAHQEVRGAEGPEGGAADLHLWCENTRSQVQSESKHLSIGAV